MEAAVVIAAAGRGTRAATGPGGVPKQYRPLGGRPVLARTLNAFAGNPEIGPVVTVLHPDDKALYVAASANYTGSLLKPVNGGDTRQASVLAGLEALSPHKPARVLIHDAARPFVAPNLIARVLEALGEADGAVPALPLGDTVKRAEDGRIAETVARGGLWAAQTPQGFRFDTILKAHRAAAKAGLHDFTDDAAIAEWQGASVVITEGSRVNLKLTTEEDFLIAERWLGSGEVRTGQGFDVHAFGPGDHVMLCGVKVPHDRALAGHSDADVGLHALTDALLGAIAQGDIGAHFPPSDPKWKGVASDRFLLDAAERIRALGGEIVNVDVTLICEVPKISPRRDAMRTRIAGLLGIDVGRVSVKATTTEGLGFTGRGEGIAAQACASVRIV